MRKDAELLLERHGETVTRLLLTSPLFALLLALSANGTALSDVKTSETSSLPGIAIVLPPR